MILDPWLYFFWALFSVPGSQICENRPSVVPDQYDPVCGATPCYVFGYCTKTYNNSAEACHDTNVVAYRPGECSTGGGPHQNYRGNQNVVVNEPICYFYLINDKGYEAGDLKDNSFTNRIPMFFYVPGQCKDIDNTMCKAGDRGKECDDTESPVCAYSYVNSENRERVYPAKISKQTMNSACIACSDPHITFYINGPCDDESNLISS